MLDICYILEGSYPYVSGGVASWVHQLIKSVNKLRIGIVHISAYDDPSKTIKYDIPPHVIYMKEVFLHEYNYASTKVRKPNANDIETMKQFYEGLALNNFSNFSKMIDQFQGTNTCFDLPEFFKSPKVYKLLNYFYEKWAPDISYIDYFWTWRSTHLPLVQVLQTVLPPARIYHSLSTGFAGILLAMAKHKHNGFTVLTEHGIYNHERMLEISQASWIYEKEAEKIRAVRDLSFFKSWWVNMFGVMSRLCYENCDQVITLFEANRIRQISDGAEASSTTVIPNGVPIPENDFERKLDPDGAVGLIGRVVSIKDIKTFLQAARTVLNKRPQTKFYCIGPTEEEPDYYDECLDLAASLGLGDSFKFTGMSDVSKYYSFLDIVALTSVSEAQPLVILEASRCGIPIVASDVGACREMLEGRERNDRSLGSSGIITPVADSNATADAILTLLSNPELAKSMGESGKQRVKTYYNQDDLFSRYLTLYEYHV